MKKNICILDYGSGNVGSVKNLLDHLNYNSQVSNDTNQIKNSTHIILPGVGAFADCKKGLEKIPGMLEALDKAVFKRRRPFFGICVGMQLMADCGFEDGETKGLGWISGNVDAIPDTGLPIPHMGWNELVVQSEHPVLKDVHTGDHAYFVHSYHFINSNPDECLAVANYGAPVTAVIGKNTAFGVQFHPEISQNTGMKIFENWINWRP